MGRWALGILMGIGCSFTLQAFKNAEQFFKRLFITIWQPLGFSMAIIPRRSLFTGCLKHFGGIALLREGLQRKAFYANC